MDPEVFEHHLLAPQGRDRRPENGHTGTAGDTGVCGDEITIALALDATGTRVAEAGFSASGCGATTACGSALVDLITDAPILAAAKVGPTTISDSLGALSPGKFHAAELASDALHRALGAAVRAGATLPAAEDRTLVAMSGGVDSAVAALLESERGDAVAVTLELWTDPEGDADKSCCSASAVRSARALAHRLGLAHVTLDLREEFRAGVVEPWIAGYANGETPNPCVRCNGHVRLDAMLDLADRLGAAHLATGHYARTAEDDHEDGPLLRVAADPAKDQTYMLAQLEPGSLARMRFPLGALTKPEVRERAAAAGLPVAGKPDSQDLCFLAGVGRERFLARRLPERPGPIVDRAGRTLGRHRGQHTFTVGQRKGIGLAAAEPLFVVGKDGDRVIAGPRAELDTTRVPLRDLVLRRGPERVRAVKLRYRTTPVDAHLDGDTLVLAEPVAGAAPGQQACLLDGDLVVGYATIDATASSRAAASASASVAS